METVVITDSCCDMPRDYIQENGVIMLGLNLFFRGEEYVEGRKGAPDMEAFYDALRDGERPQTSQINPYSFAREFSQHISKGKAVLYIGLSSGLSGCVSAAHSAAKTLRLDYPDCDITIIDSLGGSMGQGLLVYHACEMKKQGKSKEEIVVWLERNKQRIHTLLTVDDLEYLYRGGRLPRHKSLIGGLLKIKPILRVNQEGRIISDTRVRGRKKVLQYLADTLKKQVDKLPDQVVAITHGNCQEDAEYLARLIQSEYIETVLISPVGVTIGTHLGCKSICIFFMGEKERDA